MRQEVQVYLTIKLKSLSQRFEESDEGDRQMGFGFRPFYVSFWWATRVLEQINMSNKNN